MRIMERVPSRTSANILVSPELATVRPGTRCFQLIHGLARESPEYGRTQQPEDHKPLRPDERRAHDLKLADLQLALSLLAGAVDDLELIVPDLLRK